MTKNGLLDFVVLLAAAFFYRMLFASIKCLPFDCKVFAGQGKGLPIFECPERPNTELLIKVYKQNKIFEKLKTQCLPVYSQQLTGRKRCG